MNDPFVTIVVPSFNQGNYLNTSLKSVIEQRVPTELFVMDGGSSDCSLTVIQNYNNFISEWRSYPDEGQAAAINEGVAMGNAPYVCWLNSDDWFLPNGLDKLANFLDANPQYPAVYGRSYNYFEKSGMFKPVWIEPFSEQRLAVRCIISQPATLIRRSVWEAIGGVDTSLHMSMDYDLWWRIYKRFGPLGFLDDYVAVNREHDHTKTRLNRRLHYKESMAIVRKYYGSTPLKWWLFQPYSVWYKSLFK